MCNASPSECQRMRGLTRPVPAALLCVVWLAAGAEEPAKPARVPGPVYIPRGPRGDEAWDATYNFYSMSYGRGVDNENIWGNSRVQLDELVRQCGIRGVVDLGRGWKCADPKRAFEGFYSAEPDLEWPAFEAGPDRDGKLPALRDVLAAFFKDRPAYRFSIDKSGLVWIEPRDRNKRMGWLLRRRFPKPVSSDVHEEKGWVIRGHDVEEALKAAYSEWKRSGTEFWLAWDLWGLVIMPPVNVYPIRETSISNLGEFLRLWIAARPNRYVIVQQYLTVPVPEDPPNAPPKLNVRVTEWHPARVKATAAELVGWLKKGAKVPGGYISQRHWAKDCHREIERRYHFESDRVFAAIVRSDLGAEFYWSGDERVGFLHCLDKRRFRPYLRASYAAASRRDKIKGRRAHHDGPPAALEEADYFRYWEQLAGSDDPTLKKIGESRLRK